MLHTNVEWKKVAAASAGAKINNITRGSSNHISKERLSEQGGYRKHQRPSPSGAAATRCPQPGHQQNTLAYEHLLNVNHESNNSSSRHDHPLHHQHQEDLVAHQSTSTASHSHAANPQQQQQQRDSSTSISTSASGPWFSDLLPPQQSSPQTLQENTFSSPTSRTAGEVASHQRDDPPASRSAEDAGAGGVGGGDGAGGCGELKLEAPF